MTRLLPGSMLFWALAGCGSEVQSLQKGSGNESEAGLKGQTTVQLQISEDSQTQGLALAGSPLTFEGKIAGCSSGFSQKVTEATGEVKVYKGDTNCVFSLSSLTFGGESFLFEASRNWSTGQVFEVAGSAGTKMRFSVAKNLDTKIAAAQTISVSFGAPTNRGTQGAAATISQVISIAGVEPLKMSVSGVELIDVAASGGGVFKLALTCDTPVQGTDASAKCGSQTLATLRFGLIADPNPASTLDLPACREIALRGQVAGSVVNAGSTNGGLAINSIGGPAPLHSNPQLLFAIAEPTALGGCLYVRIQLPPAVQPTTTPTAVPVVTPSPTPTPTPAPKPAATATAAATPDMILRTLYVSPSGSGSTCSKAAPCALGTVVGMTLPGDLVLLTAGQYNFVSREAITQTRSGSDGRPIVYRSEVPRAAVFNCSGNAWSCINIKANYINIEDLMMKGDGGNLILADAEASYNDYIAGGTNWTLYSKFNMNAINIGMSVPVHHIVIHGNSIERFPAGGVAGKYTDYLFIEDNFVSDNSHFSMYATSGITFIYPTAQDELTTYKHIIRRNVVIGNSTRVKWHQTKALSDGNGIIIDSTKNRQTSGIAYVGRTLVENNLAVFNGGSGIHSFDSEHVDIINNTAYFNGQVVGYAEIFAGDSNDVNLLNNIMVCKPGGKVNDAWRNTAVRYDYNLYFGAAPLVSGPHDKIGVDPQFVAPSTTWAGADFRLKAGSPALNIGTSELSPDHDINGRARPVGAGIDVGAFESW